MIDVTIHILTGIVIAAASSWITVQLSLRRFRTERWWDRKADAYARLIEALHNSKAFADSHLEAEYRGHEIPKDKVQELLQRSHQAHEEIQKVIDTGSFILSAEALARLRLYTKESADASKAASWQQHLELDLAATDKCLKDIIEIARKDLKTSR